MNYGMDYQGGGGGGGGFNAGGGGGYGSSSSQAPNSGGRARRSYDEQSVIPVTIRMLQAARPPKDAGGGGFDDNNPNSLELEDGRRLLSRVTLVAATRSVEESSTSVIYQVEDGTGLMEVKQWFDENSCSASADLRQPTLRENIYLKIVGTVKIYENNTMILADSVRVLSTSNELTHHLLEVVYSAEKARRKTTYVPGVPSMMMSGVGFGAAPPSAGGRGGVPLQANTGSNTNVNVGGGSLTNIVATYIRQHGDHTERGANVQDCIQELRGSGRYTEGEIRKAVDDLASEGHIYSTIDDNYFKYAA